MKTYGLSVFSLAVLAMAISLACGSSPQRVLKSVSLTPATANAGGSSVQFAATGYFNQQPSPVEPRNDRSHGQRERARPMRGRRQLHLYRLGVVGEQQQELRRDVAGSREPLWWRRRMPGHWHSATDMSIKNS